MFKLGDGPDPCDNCGEMSVSYADGDRECYDCRTGEAVPDQWDALQDEMGCAGARSYMGVRDGE